MSSSIPARELRQQIRQQRRQLTDRQRQQAAETVAERIAALQLFKNASHIAAYLAFDGEFDPTPLIDRAIADGKQIYLPLLFGKDQPMAFAPYRPGDLLQPNRFGILEPQVTVEQRRSPQQLDLVITPLVAFDEHGTRMGMGGGFYDRTFAFLNSSDFAHQPRLLAVAFELQKTAPLIRQPWDVPVDGIVTEAALYPGADGRLPT